MATPGPSATATGGGVDRGQNTRERLVLAAERLFAEDGIGAVSMRRINSAANQKNVSALHYHFGSRDAILEAIFEYRMAQGTERRRVLLDDITAQERQGDLRALVHAAIWPLAEQIMTAARPNCFIRFLAQCQRLPQFDSWLLVRHQPRHTLVRVYLMILRRVDDLPRPIVHTRTIMALRHAIYVLADLDRVIEERQAELRDARVAFHANELIDTLTEGLTAPMAPDTRAAWDDLIGFTGPGPTPMFGPEAWRARPREGAAPNTRQARSAAAETPPT